MTVYKLRNAGDVYEVDPGATASTDTKWRRYVLLHNCEGDVGSAALAYSSTKDTERAHGAQAVVVHGSWMGIRDCGFPRRTFVYTSRIVPVGRQHLANLTGNTGRCWETIKASLEVALGLGKGTCREGDAKGSLRGTIVQVTRPIAELIYTTFGVLVTEPTYSKKRHYQVLVPLYPDPGRLRDGDLIVEGEPWMAALIRGGKAPAKLLVDPSLALSIYYEKEVSRPLPGVVDGVTIAAIDGALRQHFAL